MRVITVPIADRPECATALASALILAKKLGANVIGCHVRPHRDSSVSMPESLGSQSCAAANLADVSADADPFENSSNAAHHLLDRLAALYGFKVVKKLNAGSEPAAMWHERVGSPDRILSIIGPISDMLVVSRPNGDKSKVAETFMLEALLRSARPVMILPQNSPESIGKRILIAWNQSNEAMRAIVAALPVLQKAETVAIAVAGRENGVGPKSSQLVQYLKYWGIKPNVVRVASRNAGSKLLAAYDESNSDLLVMGAYSRSRLKQRLFGGVTDFMLRSANIPVLMLHS